jgi:hypothetical protein
LYLPWAQDNNFNVPVAFVIRTAVDPASITPSVRGVLKAIDGTLPLRRVQPLDVFVTESTAPERFRTMVLGIVAILGLVLAAVGISGVTYRGVIDRTKEFAVRFALGSEPGGVVRLVLWESARDLALGAVAGLAGGAALCGVLGTSMENIGAVDALTTGVSIGLIALVGMAAACLPALRVLRVQPACVCEVRRGDCSGNDANSTILHQYFQRGTSRCSNAKDGSGPGVTTTRTQPTSGEPGTSSLVTLPTVRSVARVFNGWSVVKRCESP